MGSEITETHVYNHYDSRPPEASFKISVTTRGPTWEVELKYVTKGNFESACQLYSSIERIIRAEVGEDEEEETEEES